MTNPLSRLREDAFVLNGLARALRALQDKGGSDMRDGTAALIESVCEKAGALAQGLETLDAMPSAELAAAILAGPVPEPEPVAGAATGPRAVSDAA